MAVKVFSCLAQGLEGKLVEVEVDILQGLSAFSIVGLGDAAVQEAKERIRSAIKNSGFTYPQTKKIINLAPAHLKKHGPHFDLAMAVGLLAASGQMGAGAGIGPARASGQIHASGHARAKSDAGALQNHLFVGELALDGSVRPVNGVLTFALFAAKNGWKKIIIPAENFAEASLIKNIEIIPVSHLREVHEYFQNTNGLQKPKNAPKSLRAQTFELDSDRAPVAHAAAAPAPPQHQMLGQHQMSTLNVGPTFNVENTAPPVDATATFTPAPDFIDLADIRGQEEAKRALIIAAAGGHHLLFTGPPGVGKTMLARALPGILPPMTEEEMLEVMQIYSLAGLACPAAAPAPAPNPASPVQPQAAAYTPAATTFATSTHAGAPTPACAPAAGLTRTTNEGAHIGSIPPLPRARPFRQVHPTCTLLSLTGGGANLNPGEISLAHHGILFLDEIAEFPRAHLESLRQPLEEKAIHLSRASGSIKYPANFTLIASMNPCPCGYAGDSKKKCHCLPYQVISYRKKLSGPILDRIDLTVEVKRQPKKMFLKVASLSSADAGKLIFAARQIQKERFANSSILTNSEMSPSQLKIHCSLSPDCEEYLRDTVENLDLSGRNCHQILKVSRTIADLNRHDQIQSKDLTEATRYLQKSTFP